MKKIDKIIDYLLTNKWVVFLIFFAPLILLGTINIFGGPDCWFIFKYGEQVVNHGVPHTDFLSMHSGMHLIMQQWGSAVIYYLIYSNLGKYGVFIFISIILVLYSFVLYKFCMYLSKGRYLLSTLISLMTVFCLEANFILIRPQLFTYLILILTLFIMEKFYDDRKSKLIYFIPLLSLIQVNLHGALYFMMYIFMLPYVFCYFLDFIKNKDKTLFKVLGIILVSLLVGLINPYGFEMYTFIFKSYGRSDLSDLIHEMRRTTLGMDALIYFYITLFVSFIIYACIKKERIKLRHLLLLLGTMLLGFLNGRNVALFYLGTIPFFSYYLRDVFGEENKYSFKKPYILMYLSFAIAYVIICTTFNISDKSDYYDSGKYLKDNYDKDIVLYAPFNVGSYYEYLGYHPYIDSRAEVYFKSLNKKYDYFSEFYDLFYDNTDVEAFLNKYNFDVIVVEYGDTLNKYLNRTNLYTPIYYGEKSLVYEKK